MYRSSISRFAQIALATTLAAACAGEGGSSCAPTDATCGSPAPSPTPPPAPPPAPICTECPATSFTRADVEAQGKVVQTSDGFTVDGSLSVRTGDGKRITFLGAHVDVRFDENGRLRSISGKAQIPSPHERIVFGDPVRADVGLFTGRFLNEKRAGRPSPS